MKSSSKYSGNIGNCFKIYVSRLILLSIFVPNEGSYYKKKLIMYKTTLLAEGKCISRKIQFMKSFTNKFVTVENQFLSYWGPQLNSLKYF